MLSQLLHEFFDFNVVEDHIFTEELPQLEADITLYLLFSLEFLSENRAGIWVSTTRLQRFTTILCRSTH